MREPNLTPYGHAHPHPSAPLDVNPYVHDAFARAEMKLNALRLGATHESPAGRIPSLFFGRMVLCVALALPLLLIGTALAFDTKSNAGGVAAVLLLIAAGLIALGIWLLVSARPNTPARALKYYLKAVGMGKVRRAANLVVSNDYDDFPRYPPQMIGFGRAGVRAFHDVSYLEGYWNELVRYHSSPYCIVSVHGVREQQIAPDLVVVDCEVRFAMNTQLWLLLVLVGGVIALLVDMATRKRVNLPIRKLLYRVGDEWKVFNGELQGLEEQDLRWLSNVQA